MSPATYQLSSLFFFSTDNEFPLLAGHLKLIKTLFTCEDVDKRGLGKLDKLSFFFKMVTAFFF